MILLKKIRNVLMIMLGMWLLGCTYIIYFVSPQTQEQKDFWQQKFGEWHDSIPYMSIPLGVLLVLFAIASSLMILLRKRDPA